MWCERGRYREARVGEVSESESEGGVGVGRGYSSVESRDVSMWQACA